MSEQQFIEGLGFQKELNITDLNLTAAQTKQLRELVEKQSNEIVDYTYNPRDIAIARTAIADLKSRDKTGTIISAASFPVACYFLHKKFRWGDNRPARKILYWASFFVSTGIYYAATHDAYNKYRGIATQLNTRISKDFNAMMNLENKEE